MMSTDDAADGVAVLGAVPAGAASEERTFAHV
jgi:hypothetical protein